MQHFVVFVDKNFRTHLSIFLLKSQNFERDSRHLVLTAAKYSYCTRYKLFLSF